MDGDTNLKTYNLQIKTKNNGNDKGNKKLTNLDCHYISSAISASNIINLKGTIKSLGVSKIKNPRLGDLYFGLY